MRRTEVRGGRNRPKSEVSRWVFDETSRAECIRSALGSAAAVFQLPPEKPTTVTRSPEKLYGFEEAHGEEYDEVEEFEWCKG
ncbi:hypothetical protein F3Y22_tig00112344pilonHSYRG00064 [Hibiscus syriacus]|uniref:Uncharacterized protein n=1 Tax=Hibiscus syriacus TaxID=106335 RepID=A0A6A2XEM9_HIBSY|nr:hypothetical protein F3Y22_tig00112344pilonHSYRG00064 [Hibiscus syriacus]